LGFVNNVFRITLDQLGLRCLPIFFLIIIFLSSCSDNQVLDNAKLNPVIAPQDSSDSCKLPNRNLPDLLCRNYVSYGYCDKVSYSPGETITAFIQAKDSVVLCALTTYGLNGDSIFSVPSPMIVQSINSDRPSSNGYGFLPNVQIKVPVIASGVYLIEKQIPFIVKPSGDVDIVIVYPSNTANAYSQSGGKSLYSSHDRPTSLSFQRPISLQDFCSSCLLWFQTLTNFRIGYIADIDMEDFDLASSKLLIVPGHSEYWTRQARQNFDQFIDKGGDALILSGNTMWWQVRYSEDRTKLICYKDISNDPISDPLLKTYKWDDSTLNYSILSSIGADFDHGGYGLKYDNGWDGFKIVTPGSPLLQGTDLNSGDIVKCPTAEYDGAPLRGFDAGGNPTLDLDAMGVYKAELIGYDWGFRVHETAGTFFVVKKKLNSGTIINIGSTNWCSESGIGGQSKIEIEKITMNAIVKLLNHEPVFSNLYCDRLSILKGTLQL
jgi:hypothetical protein